MTEWISSEEAATMSGYHVEHIRRLIRQGKLRAEKKGHDWWIDRSDLAAFLDYKKDSGDNRWGPKSDKSIHSFPDNQ